MTPSLPASVFSPWTPKGSPPLLLHRFSVEEYHRLIQAGVLHENHRVELLEGWIVNKMAHNPPHDSVIDLVVGELNPLLPLAWFPRVQSAITTEDSEPEPDVAVVRGPRGRYSASLPRPADIGMLIEVSDTTLVNDRTFKGPLFARARVPIYWIVNIPEERVEIHTEPSGPDSSPGYRKLQVFGKQDQINLVLDGQELGKIAVNSLFAAS